MTEASLLGNCQQEQRHFRHSNHLAFERLKRLLERETSLPSLAFGRAYPITCKIVNLAHVVGSVDLLRGQAFEVLTVPWDGGYQPGILLGPLQGSSGLLTLEQFFPPGGLEGPPRRSSKGGGLTPLLPLPDCVLTTRSTNTNPGPDRQQADHAFSQ